MLPSSFKLVYLGGVTPLNALSGTGRAESPVIYLSGANRPQGGGRAKVQVACSSLMSWLLGPPLVLLGGSVARASSGTYNLYYNTISCES